MALVVKDRVRESSATSGTGSITLSGAYVGFQTFSSVVSDGSTVFYCIHNTSPGVETEWEVGFGTYSAGVLSRDTLYSSSTGSTVSFSAGTKEVFITYPSEAAVYEDNDGNVTVEGKITVGAAPTAELDVATKQYVDNAVAAALHYHDPVRLEHPGNLPGTYDNGAAGVGATLTNNSTQVALTADGVAVDNGDRVIFYEQTDATQNGVYVVTDKGSVSTNWVLTRATDADSYAPSSPDTLGQGDAFYVQEGATAAGESYVCTTQGTITFGTTDITFSQFSATPQYTGTGNINVTGQVISLTGTVDETNGGTGISTYTLGEVLYASGATTLAQLPGNTTTTAKYLTQTGTGSVSAAPTWTALAASATTDTTNASNISSGTLPSARISGSYTGITGVGTLTAGTWNAGTVGAAYGGTGLTSYTIGDIVYATGTTTIGKLADIAVGNVLLSGGIGVQPEYGKVGLTTHVSGVLPLANGGTGQTTASGAINALTPSQTGNSTKFLQTDGSVVSWQQPTTLYNSTNIKLATTATGIDVTGTVVADGIDVTGDVVASGDISANGGDVDITGAQPRINLHENDTTDVDVTLRLNAGDFIIETRSDAGAALGDRIRAHNNGDVSFYEDTGATAKFVWDASAERLEVGGNAQTGGRLYLESGSATSFIKMYCTAGTGGVHTIQGSGTNGLTLDVTADQTLTLNTNGAEHLRITSAGNVGIGTSSPSELLSLYKASGDPALNIQSSAGNCYVVNRAGTSAMDLLNSMNGPMTLATNNAERMRIDSAGNVGIGTTSPQSKLHVAAGSAGVTPNSESKLTVESSGTAAIGILAPAASESIIYFGSPTSSTDGGIIYNHTSRNMIFRTGGNAERMRIDSAGNVGIGTTSLDSKLNVNGRVFAQGSLTSNSGDSNFGAGGSRAFIDWDGSKARIGTLTGGGSGGPIGFFVNNSELASLDTSGNFTAAGNVTAYSDERLKKDWEEVKPNFVDQLANVKSGTYTRTDSDARQAGVSAQSLQELLPETVMAGKDGMLSVAYGNAAMVAVVELAKEVRKLKEELRALKGE